MRCPPQFALQGAVDDRLIQKYEREAKEKNRESWYMAYIMDTNEEERAKARRALTVVDAGAAHLGDSFLSRDGAGGRRCEAR